MIEKYFEPFYLQEYKETASDLPPPHNKPIKKLVDGKPVMGLFVLQNTSEGMQAQVLNEIHALEKWQCGKVEGLAEKA